MSRKYLKKGNITLSSIFIAFFPKVDIETRSDIGDPDRW
jgi:hypothetical protein